MTNRRNISSKEFNQEKIKEALSKTLLNAVEELDKFVTENPGKDNVEMLVGDVTINKQRYYLNISIVADRDVEKRPTTYFKPMDNNFKE